MDSQFSLTLRLLLFIHYLYEIKDVIPLHDPYNFRDLVMLQPKMDKELEFECIVRIEPGHVWLSYSRQVSSGYKSFFGLKISVSSPPF